MNKKAILKLRDQIDCLDEKIQKLLCQRILLVKEILANKEAEQQAIRCPERERQILDRIKEVQEEPLVCNFLVSVYEKILQESLLFQKKSLTQLRKIPKKSEE